MLTNKNNFSDGLKDGLSLAFGYMAVSIGLGIAAKEAGLTAFQRFLSALSSNGSTGEYISFRAFSDGETYLQLALLIFIANSRYFLMSSYISQRIDPKMPYIHRFFMNFVLTDEIFGLAISKPGYVNPYYLYGLSTVALPAWAGAGALGVIIGNFLSPDLSRALSISLYGMFLSTIIPHGKKNRTILLIIIISFVSSFLWDFIPMINQVSNGIKVIVLTIAIALFAAVFFPIEEVSDEK